MYGDSRLSDLPGTHRDTCIDENSGQTQPIGGLRCHPLSSIKLTQGATVVAATQRAVEAVVSCRLHLILGRQALAGGVHPPAQTDRHTAVEAKAPDLSIATALVHICIALVK